MTAAILQIPFPKKIKEESETWRLLDCPHYDDCLSMMISPSIMNFTCSACHFYKKQKATLIRDKKGRINPDLQPKYLPQPLLDEYNDLVKDYETRLIFLGPPDTAHI